MKFTKSIAACLSLPPIAFLLVAALELFNARADTAHLYPFGSAHAGWFYQSLAHYRLGLSIDAVLAMIALVSVVGIWRARKYSWVPYLPFFFWAIFTTVTAYSD